MKIHFEHLIVASFQTSGGVGDGGVPTESISLNFVKFQIIYSPLDKDGRPSGHIPVTYDLKSQEAS
jgi:type VI protein secretion system component Hcp